MKSNSTLLVAIVLSFLCQFTFAQEAQQVSPSENNPKAVELIKRALLFEDTMQFQKAIEIYKEVLRLEPKDFAAMNTIAGLYGKLENPAEEVVWAKKAIDANPKYFQAHINFGNGYALQGKFDEALRAYRDAAKLAPKSPLPIYSQGVVAENQGRIKEALELYRKSFEVDAKFEDGLFSAAAMHANLGQFAEAKVLLKKVIELNPQAADAREMLKAVDREKPD